jgi:mannose-6-phosphate isomerase-like protein (cupin superfamily)
MPVIKMYQYQDIPKWSELKKYDRITLARGDFVEIKAEYPKIAVAVLSGCCVLTNEEDSYGLEAGKYLKDIGSVIRAETGSKYKAVDKCELMIIQGTWEWIHIGFFKVGRFEQPYNRGSDAPYYRNTGFDNHYHDYEEDWIVTSGSGVVQTEGQLYEVKCGDCVCTQKGCHHDFPIVHEFVEALALLYQPKGECRKGHLWEYQHGIAVPETDEEDKEVEKACQ